MTSRSVSREVRWVLRNARACACDHDLRSRAGMARALGVHRSQVGRWEEGPSGLHERHVRGYESVLQLPADTLVCAVDVLSRDLVPMRGHATLELDVPADPPGAVLPLLERAVGGDRMTGRDWTTLAGLLDLCRDVVMRQDDWRDLVHRCVLEMAVTHGLENILRWEASARLVAHPRCHRVAAELAAEALDDPHQQLFADYTALTQYSPDPACVEVILRHLSTDLPDDRLWAVLLAAATFARQPAKRARVAASTPVLLQLLLDESRSLRVRRAAAAVLSVADPAAKSRLTATLSGRAARAARLLHQGSNATAAELADVRREVVARLDEQHLAAHDPTFRRILRRASDDADEDARGNALALLVLSAQGPTVGRVYGDRLGRALSQGDVDLASEHLSVLCWLAQPADLDLLTRLATSSSPLAQLSGYALGNCVEPAAPARHSRDRVLVKAAQEGRGSPAGVSYALALRGRFDLLDRVRRNAARHDRPDWQRRSTWWLSLPASIQELASQHYTGTTRPT